MITNVYNDGKLKVWQFNHASVSYKEEFSLTTNREMPNLYVQVIDSYSFQREWILQKRHKSGDSGVIYWESHIYQHPGRRSIQEVSEYKAKKVLEKFLLYCEEYPTLLFTPEGITENACHKGFVHFAERLHRGEKLSATML